MALDFKGVDFSDIGTTVSGWINFIKDYDYSVFIPVVPYVLVVCFLILLYALYRWIQEQE